MTYDNVRFEQGFKDILAGVSEKREFIRRVKVDVFCEDYDSNLEESDSEEINQSQSEKNLSFKKINV